MEGIDVKPIPMSEQPMVITSESRYLHPWVTGRLVEDVAIKFLNRTGKMDFSVVVFVKNESSNAASTKFVAWHVLRTQSAASFVYPLESQVGALYEDDGVRMRAGPHVSRPASTWEFYQEIPMATPFMREDVTAPPNSEEAIVIRNMPPKMWAGRPFNFGVFKCSKLFLTQHMVGVGSQAEFKWKPHLYFGVVKKMDTGQVFQSVSVTQDSFCVDLTKFQTGLLVTLTQNHSSGEYKFRARNYSMPKTKYTSAEGISHFRHYYPN